MGVERSGSPVEESLPRLAVPAGRTVLSRRAVLAAAAAGLMAGCGRGDRAGQPSPPQATAGATPGSSTPGSAAPAPSTPAAEGGADPSVTATIAEGLDTPWSLAFLPDGTALVSERDTALLRRIGPASGGSGGDGAGGAEAGGGGSGAAGRGLKETVAEVPGTVRGGEGGLLGLALSPDFPRDGLLYVYRTAADGNRVSSFRYGDGLGRETVLLGEIPSSRIHNGGRIAFGPDGFLYVGTGDAAHADSAQDTSSLAGKILRLARDGTPAPGNPFGNAVHSFGHRNVQGLAWDGHGRLWASEFGPDRDDELNLVRAGQNHGWPLVTGTQSAAGTVPAVHVWPSPADASPSGVAILGGTAYVACLRGQRLWRLPLPGPGTEYDAGGRLPGAAHFLRGNAAAGGFGRLRDIVAAPDGTLWLATNEGSTSRVLRVEA
ncbi:oxidoreductase [Zafaria cholistanensis]|uniref:Oxidoreductase n=1 Tax=Zafaria cholistanensis TaxID=1682741 RepID=A0A5A7NQH8_9MICC|nr:PQQ-dependent sugar dehydrogenase [Zafaria cholistanensis]GER22959.1 oxidoreductase [Zafaria cholistanensis]